MNFWNDPYIEALTASQKLLYLYLFTCPHTNNLGLIEISEKKIVFESGVSARDVSEALSRFESDGKIVRDGLKIWLTNFIKHQTTTSEKLISGLQKLIPNIESTKICHAVCIRYPHVFEGTGYRIDTLSIPHAEREGEGERENELEMEGEGEGSPEPQAASAPHAPSPVVAYIPVVGKGGGEAPVTQADVDEWQTLFPAVDVPQEIRNIRAWNLANPSKRKTMEGYKKHIVTWLTKEQNKGGRHPQGPKPQQGAKLERTISNMQEWLSMQGVQQ
ncbi:MAG: hypothetical protein EOL87_18500 [Spartobacteria bacterium]|nr:hypothetical protein [Spartobacteria bacterium]